MSRKKKTPFPKDFFAISLKTGFISAVLMSVSTFAFYLIWGSASKPVLIFNHFILLVMMYITVKKYRTQLNGFINFKECYISGLSYGIVASLFFAVFVYLNTKYIDKQLISNFITESEAAMNKYISGDELQKQKEILYQYQSPMYMGIRASGELILMSIFLPLLMSVMLKKEIKTQNSNESINK